MISAQQSRLISLPAELRLKIYEHVFEEHIIDVRKRNGCFERLSPPGLLLTCKQIHNEAVDIFYASATIGLSGYEKMLTVRRLIPSSHRGTIKGVQIDFTITCPDLRWCAAILAGCDVHTIDQGRVQGELRGRGEDSLAESIEVKCLHCEKLNGKA